MKIKNILIALILFAATIQAQNILMNGWRLSGNNLSPLSTLYNVGIGTVSPDKKFGLGNGTDEFSQDVTSDKWTLWNDASTPAAIMTVDSTGLLNYRNPHAGSFREDITLDITLTTKDVYYKILPTFPTVPAQGVEFDGITCAGDSLTIITPGDYFLTMGITQINGTDKEEYKYAFFLNGVKVYGIRRTWTTGNATGGDISLYFTNLVAGDDISFRMTNLTNDTDTARISNINFYIYKVPEL
jgi:hypothetical protein